MRLFIILVLFIKVSSEEEVEPMTVLDNTNVTSDANLSSSANKYLLQAFDLAFAYCPNIYFCTHSRNTSSSDENVQPQDIGSYCCFECSCKDECILFNTCCPDAPILSNQTFIEGNPLSNETTDIQLTTPTFACVLPVVPLGKRYFSRFYNDSLENGYRIINTCSDQSIAKSCTAKYDVIEDGRVDLSDFQIVSSTDGRFIYQNEKCAACNGVTSILRWELRAVDCVTQLTSSTRILSLMEILDDCTVKSVPPADFNSWSLLCFPGGNNMYISSCSTSHASKRDLIINNLCTNGYHYTYLRMTQSGTLAYKNIFCFLCNIPNDQQVKKQLTCRIRKKGLSNKITYLLDPASSYQMDTSIQKDRPYECPFYEDFDNDLRRCRSLYCYQINELPYNGKCVRQGFSTDQLKVMRLVKLTATTTDNLPGSGDILNARDQIFEGILDAFEIRERCQMAKFTTIDVFLSPMATDVDQLIIEIEVPVTNECPYDFIADKMMSPFESRIDVRIDGFVYTFDMEVLVMISGDGNINLYDEYKGLNVLSTFQQNIMETYPRRLTESAHVQTPVMQCPYYILSKNEFCTLLLNYADTLQTSPVACEDVNNSLFKMVTVINTEAMLENRYFICADVYTGLFRNSSNTTKMLEITYLFLALVFLCLV